MNFPVVPLGIRFDDFVFTEARHISQWLRPPYAGVLVVLGSNPNWAPKPFEPLCFEEFGNNGYDQLAQVVRLPEHASVADVFFAVLPMPFSTTAQRCSLRDQLITAYNPVWQRRGSAHPAGLAEKLDELEKKNEEQSTQLRLLLATMNKLFEPQPEPPRRTIGFLRQPAPATPKRAY